jgi:hypothetical protein
MPSATVHNRRTGRVMFPDEPHPSRVPYADGGTVPWDALTAKQQGHLRGWLVNHGVDPARVVRGGLFAYDPDTDEWRIEIHAHRDGAPYSRPGGELATVVRRVWARSRDFGRKRGRGGRLVAGPPARVEFGPAGLSPADPSWKDRAVDLGPYLAGEVPYGHEHRRAQ